ncbi:MAG: chromosome segregation ATPase [Cyanophyceae cyanobacterium]
MRRKPEQTKRLEVGKAFPRSNTALSKQSHRERDMSSHPAAQPGTESNTTPQRGWLSFPWLAALLIVIFGSVGFVATSALLKLPAVANCPKIFLPLASASKRLYCAQVEAEKATVDSLLEAIALVKGLPANHPLRSDIDHLVEQWSVEILDLAEADFQAGKLKTAVATARRIPQNVRAYSLVEERVERWQTIWSKAEQIAAATEKQLRQSNWNEAFRAAVKLVQLDNHYWATTKYRETVDTIQVARQESQKLDDAFAALETDSVDDWLEAVAEADRIATSSYVYQEAQELIEQAREKFLGYIQRLLVNRNWQPLLSVTNRLPGSLELEQVDEWRQLARAGTSADQGTISSLERAIAEAERIEEDSALYADAQQLVERWYLEIDDLHHLLQARELARAGNIGALSEAIAEARVIPRANPRYQEAQAEIQDWRRQIETIEDQPYLSRARELASGGTIRAWQAAIAQARLIASGRALHSEAQREIRRWRNRIEREEDQPYLDEAVALSYSKNYADAINFAQQIRPGRVLYEEARNKIQAWQREIRAEELIERAYEVARSRTPAALLEAIRIAQQVPASTEPKRESQQALNRWGNQLLAIAIDTADNSLRDAIDLAAKIPSGTEAYQPAQAQIARWEARLNPPPLVIPESPFSEEPQEL